MGAIEDILDWSSVRLPPWQQDALRRLACQASLSQNDHEDLLNLVKESVGFQLATKPPAAVPLGKTHFLSASAGAPLHLKSIRNIENVNRLVPSAGLSFAQKGLTVIYGRNGSGKSGFVRILRTACRTRVDNPAKLKVLADVYGSGGGAQKAEIVIDMGGSEVVVPWTTGGTASEVLRHVSIFDSSAAQLYVDGGSEIRFLPFGLALPHKLNELCLALKAKMEDERRPITAQLAIAAIDVATGRQTKAQVFYAGLNAKTTDAQIDVSCKFDSGDQTRLDQLTRLLTGSSATAADLTALGAWVDKLHLESKLLHDALADSRLDECRELKRLAIEARHVASLDSSKLFAGEPFPGVGKDVWRRLWLAARDYSIAEAYPKKDFPVLNAADKSENCVLCHQPLSPEASERLARFQAFVDGALAQAADLAEEKVFEALSAIPELNAFASSDWEARIEQITKRNAALGKDLSTFGATAESRQNEMRAILQSPTASTAPTEMLSFVSSEAELAGLSKTVTAEAVTATQADDVAERAKLVQEHAELEDRKVLSIGRDRIVARRDLLKQDGVCAAALAELSTTGITRKANDLVDVHLTKAVLDQYEHERKALEITHLRVTLARKSGQTKTTFQTTPGTTLTKLASDILSEGEQRALALAAFLTEVTVTDGSGPIVIDDPVSSLDRQRGLKVAARLAAEAKKRQVIVFTHDLIFFNDLCRGADEQSVPTETVALFSDGSNAGKVDPAGVIWKGLNVAKRLARLKNDYAPVKKMHNTSAADYEVHIKNFYGRLRDTYERLVEEVIFCDVIRRGSDRIETQKLRLVQLPDALAIRFHDGMTKANTHSHDNPESATVPTPEPPEFESDIAFIEELIADLKKEQANAEANRPSMGTVR